MKKPIVLRVYKGEQLLGVKQFLQPQIVIGQPSDGGETQIALEGDAVSILHASIEEREDGYFVSDLGSSSGTYLNGQQVLESQLDSGDELTIGDYRIEFYIGAPKPKTGGTVVAAVIPPSLASQAVAPAPVMMPTSAPTPTPPPMPAPLPVVPPKPPVEMPAPVEVKPREVKPPPSPVEEKPVEVKPPPVVSSPPPMPPAEPAKPTLPPPVVVAPPPVVTPPAPTPPPSRPVPPTIVPPKLVPPSAAPQTPSRPVTPPSRPAPTAPTSGGSTMQPKAPQASPVVSGGATTSVFPSSEPVSGSSAGFALVGPRPGGSAHKGKHGKKSRKTFAPPSKYSDVSDYVKPSKGTIVEVVVAWRERTIGSYHFSGSKTVTIGAHPSNDIVVPVLAAQTRKLPILQIAQQAIVLVSPEMRGQLILSGQTTGTSFADLARQNRFTPAGNSQGLALQQGEMVRVELDEQIIVVIRYVGESPKPLVAPVLDLTASEATGVVLAIALVATLWLYMYLYQAPNTLADEDNKEPVRTAMIVLTPPTPPPLPTPVATPEPTPIPAPTPVATPPPPKPTPPPKKVKIVVAEKTKAPEVKKATTSTNLTTKHDPGKSVAAAPNKNKTGPREQTSVKHGGAIKTSPKEGAQMQSKSKDVEHSGMFSAFGSGGQQDKLAQSTTGAGELAGMANAANGKAGSAEDRAGEGLGSKLKDTGMGGNGKSLEGISGGVNTTGRGSGNSGYGTGGLGTHQGAKIVTGGAGEDIKGTIDREAIRRVIQQNLKSIRACYERELNRHPDLMGKIVLTWDIGEQGRVTAAGVKSNELGNADVANCIVEKLKTWRFPEPPAGTVANVAYPFLFSN